MKKIIKSYLKTFFQKNIILTFGIIFFIVILSTTIIGILSSPLQIYLKISRSENITKKYDKIIKTEKNEYNDIFSYKYYYLNQNIIINNKKISEKIEFSDIAIDFLNARFLVDNIDDILNDNDIRFIDNKFIFDINDKKNTKYLVYLNQKINSLFYNYRLGALYPYSLQGINLSKTLNKNQIEKLKTKGFEKIFNQDISLISLKKIFDYTYNNFLRESFNNIDINNIDNYISDIFRSIKKIQSLLLINNIDTISNTNIIKFIKEIIDEYKIENANDLIKNLDKIINKLKKTINIINDKINDFDKNFSNNKNLKISIPSFLLLEKTSSILLSDFKYLYNDYNFIVNKIFENYSNDYDIQSYYAHHISTKSISFGQEMKTILSVDKFESLNDKIDYNQVLLNNKNGKLTSNFDFNVDKKPEIIISSAFANNNDLKINDAFLINKFNSELLRNTLSKINKKDSFLLDGINTKIIGTGEKLDDLMNQSKSRTNTVSVNAYVNKSLFWEMTIANWNLKEKFDNNNYFSTNIKIKEKKPSKNLINYFDISFDENDSKEINVFELQNNFIINWNESNSANAMFMIKIQVLIFLILGIIVLILAFVFINFIIKKEMNETKQQIGIFKSFGYKNIELSWVFSIKTFITMIFSISISYILSIPLQLYTSNIYTKNVAFYFSRIYFDPIFIIIVIILIPLSFLLLSYLTTLIYMKEDALSMISENGNLKTKKSKQNFIFSFLSKKNWLFIFRLRLAFTKISINKFIVVQILFLFCSFIYLLLFTTQNIFIQLMDQGVSIYNKKVDHVYKYNNNFSFKIDSENNKLGINQKNNDSIKLKYYDYYDEDIDKKINDLTSDNDMKYKTQLIVWLVGEHINTSNNKLEQILPLELAKQKLDLFIKDKTSLKYQDSFKNSFMNYFYKFNLNNNNSWWIDLINKIKENKITESDIKNNHNEIENDANCIHGNKNEQTFFTLKYSNLKYFYTNIFSELFSYKWAQTYILLKLLLEIYTNNSTLENAYNNIRNNKEIKNFNPSDSKYWSISNNPLLDFSNFNVRNKKYDNTNDNFNMELIINSLLNINDLSPYIQQFLYIATLQDKPINVYNIYEKTIMSLNSFLYNSFNEIRSLNLNVTFEVENELSMQLTMSAFDDIKNLDRFYNLGRITNEKILELENVEYDNNIPIIPAIIPYYLAKEKKINIGDIIQLKIGNKVDKLIFKIKVLEINNDETFSLNQITNTKGFLISYKALKNALFDERINTDIFNSTWSYNDSIITKLDIKNSKKMIESTKIVQKTTALNISNNSSVFTTIMKDIFNEVIFDDSYKVDKHFSIYDNPATTNFTEHLPINVLRQAIEKIKQIMLGSLFLFIGLTSIILLIVLVVMMYIIIDDRKKIILTLKATGYSNWNINNIIMSDYVFGSLFMYFLSIVIVQVFWTSLLNWISNSFHIYILFSLNINIILTTFVIIFMILFIGWLFAYNRVKKFPLSNITNI